MTALTNSKNPANLETGNYVIQRVVDGKFFTGNLHAGRPVLNMWRHKAKQYPTIGEAEDVRKLIGDQFTVVPATVS